MNRNIPFWRATNADLPDICAVCGRPLCVGDGVIDIYGDLYHAACMRAQADVDVGAGEDAPIEVHDDAPGAE